ncbi:Lj965 prophage protein [Carnobacterium sp. AT7]|uniref:hypothetical protein n=1 Tax=Carnobacterium sp. AT7 TaxID=333990 RepID=UPI00015F1989|nr:hypothetical protein [Carnobacterium sp. AT7]EDP68568.1 Lj965 prophage protein [Carnobacterium sp. AT7]
MLKTTKQITLNGQSTINDQVVVTLNANIPSETGVGNINQFTQNAELYDANKAQVRRDVAEFTALVYEVEDEMGAELEAIE